MLSTRLQGGGPSRSTRLARNFADVICGKRLLQNIKEGNLFLEALCDHPDPPACLEKIISSSHGLGALQIAMRIDVSPDFINSSASDIFCYIQSPGLKLLCGGDFLQQFLMQIVEPPIFWDSFVASFRGKKLSLRAEQSFAWLLLELISLPLEKCRPYAVVAQDITVQETLLQSSNLEIRTLGQKIKHCLSAVGQIPSFTDGYGPGGRHDNDFVDFREISIFPTPDELCSAEAPFLQAAVEIEELQEEDNRPAAHLENQFRLLREDMLGEIREETQIALGKKKGYHKGIVVNGLKLLSAHCGTSSKRIAWALQLQCKEDLPQLPKGKSEARKTYLNESKNRKIFKHESLACLIVDGEIVAFTTIFRDTDLLAKELPIITLQLLDDSSTLKALLRLKSAGIIKIIELDTAVFSFEPILRALQNIKILPLVNELVGWKPGDPVGNAPDIPLATINQLEVSPAQDLQPLLDVSRSIRLDSSQALSLLSGLRQRVSLIQGPPGTGKSFIGALIAKILFKYTQKNILVVCYTNHALDQFLEELLDMDIPARHMLRVGGKSTARTKPLALYEQSSTFRQPKESWKILDQLKRQLELLAQRLLEAFSRYRDASIRRTDLMEYLEFLPEGAPFFEAFTLPRTEDGMSRIGKRSKTVNEYYLLDRWHAGYNAGVFETNVNEGSADIWRMALSARQSLIATWKSDILQEQIIEFGGIAKEYNDCQTKVNRMSQAKHAHIIGSKRVIGCTTTAAAKYSYELQATSRDVVLVEEAGEILESHVLTALGPQTQQLVLIGDYKQLRPKVNNYRLSVEKGDGFDLNRSLLERLILKNYPNQILTQQHRMRPEISSLVRNLTYPDLKDAPKTLGRPNLRGFQDNVIFVDHVHLEDSAKMKANWKDMDATSSKQNHFEAMMVLQCVRYLAQQGYGTDKIVVLTPYLGQLHLLQNMLSKNNDPILNDLDSYDLVQAGLLPAAAARISKQPIHLATIDNYQGEEKEIVVASLTRSNESCEIGFMARAERLNVLLSRARDGLILIGNANTFLGARTNDTTWKRFFDLLKDHGHIYDGFPVKCERHPDRKALLRDVADFEIECPDGGCKGDCGTLLSCGLHKCPQHCHQLYDHSKMPCDYVLHDKCEKGHVRSWKCRSSAPDSCQKCKRNERIIQIKERKALELQEQREKAEREHLGQMAELDEKLKAQSQKLKDTQLAMERSRAIQQKKIDLAAGRSQVVNASIVPSVAPESSRASLLRTPNMTQTDARLHNNQDSIPPSKSLGGNRESLAKIEWQRQKEVENASNEAIDSMMKMVGLEDVKSQVLRIKAKIDVGLRQGANMEGERVNAIFQGNPGTGKTTVARLYAKALSSLGVLPGTSFIETTGSRLANDGIPGLNKHLDAIQNAGGGALFLDEAYQLTNGHNHGGRQVLDYLLAEMENNVGTMVFIIAGYNKEMESFMAHNPGLASRFPYSLQFANYEDHELLIMLRQLIDKKFQGKMQIEGDKPGQASLYLRVATRRLGRSRGRPGFGNARALQTLLSRILERQAQRLNRERRGGALPDDLFLSREDLIGPDPSLAIIGSKPWMKLQQLIGLSAVKEAIKNMIDRLKVNYERELKEQFPIQISLNRVFLGSPGTGKTSVANLYGKILADLGLLSNGEVVVKNPADFIGNALGQSEQNTKAILAATIGKVLIIDEAYMLYAPEGSGVQNDRYKTAVIDTIVAEVQSVPGEDRCVLLLGYKDQIVAMFQNVNPGLSRRFAIEDAFHFEDFTDDELLQILELKLQQQDLKATSEAKSTAISVLHRSRNRPNFGNAGEVENILSQAKNLHQARQPKTSSSGLGEVVFEPQDFDKDYARVGNAAANLKKLFEDVVGCESIMARLEGYQLTTQAMSTRGLGLSGQIPTNFLFKGPPGTGKTTTARKMGQVFYDMGFLSTVEVVECSASDLIGQYVGHTGPKTRAQLDKALGRVLFVDEAYRLCEGAFAMEAINELVDLLTKPQYFEKLLVILAGYEKDIDRLISINPGLSSRFPEEVIFKNLNAENCLKILERCIEKQGIEVPSLNDPQLNLQAEMAELVNKLSSLPSWGNARDIINLGKSITSAVFRAGIDPAEPLKVSYEEIVIHTRALLAARVKRCTDSPMTPLPMLLPQMSQMQENASQLAEINLAASKLEETTLLEKEEVEKSPESTDTRDSGVSDEAWQQLQIDKEAAEKALKSSREELKTKQQNVDAAQKLEMEKTTQHQKLAHPSASTDAEADDLKRRREEARLQEQHARIAREKEQAELERMRSLAEARKRQEAIAQTKLRQMGVCCAGYRWIKQAGGYRCAGGSHFVDDGALGLA